MPRLGAPLAESPGRLLPPDLWAAQDRMSAQEPSPARATLPAWCDRFLDPPGGGDFFASRAWYDTLIRQALPPGAQAQALAPDETVLWPMMRQGPELQSLTTPYTIAWRPLVRPQAGASALYAAGHAFGRMLRGQRPALLEAVDPEAPEIPPLLQGLRAAGLAVLRHDHFGNWQECLPEDQDWAGYLASRAPALRATILRKTRRAGGHFAFACLHAPGPALEEGIAAYEAVRARSWKPHEPFPAFDGALMRRAAASGALRLGLLRRADGTPAAVQYWVLSGRRATVLKLAHDEAQRAHSPGTVLTARMIAHLLEQDGVRELDFGRGDDPYKSLWVTQRRQRIGLTLADPRHPAGLIAIARHHAGRLRRGVRQALRGTGHGTT